MIPTWGQPRLCEEHGRGGVVAHELYGATPLIRGTPSRCCFLTCVLLLNPDYAGRAWPTLTEYVGLGATPQMRGTLVSALASPRLYGSPPPMRGIRGWASDCCCEIRLTPAHAGNTIEARHTGSGSPAHPRPCGEYRAGRSTVSVGAGSPPPMRGILFHHEQAGRKHGLTPAWAGNTLEETAETSQNQSQQTVKNFSLHTLQHFSVI